MNQIVERLQDYIKNEGKADAIKHQPFSFLYFKCGLQQFVSVL